MDDPIGAARALLFQFQRSQLKACHVVLEDLELFVSRDPAIHASASRSPDVPTDRAQAAGATHMVAAPHVATLLSLEPIGTVVRSGGQIGRLAVLDEEVPLLAEQGGTIVSHVAVGGELVEFSQPLVALAA